MTPGRTRAILEAILFLAQDPVPAGDLAQLLELAVSEVERELAALEASYEAEGRGLIAREVAGGWQMATSPACAPYLERFAAEEKKSRLTQAALETLAIIAYRQPVTRTQISDIRGVSSERVLQTLISRGLVEESGRDPGPGSAILYCTSQSFLEKAGMNSLEDLAALPDLMPSSEEVERMERGLGPGL